MFEIFEEKVDEERGSDEKEYTVCKCAMCIVVQCPFENEICVGENASKDEKEPGVV